MMISKRGGGQPKGHLPPPLAYLSLSPSAYTPVYNNAIIILLYPMIEY